MTSQLPPSAVPGPDGERAWEESDVHQQPDPFGDETDVEGGGEDAAHAAPSSDRDADPAERPKSDPRGE